MSLPPLIGHEDARATLANAALAGELPGALLFHGPAGIGKQRLALWLGRLLLCTTPGAAGGCDACSHCRLADRLEHPDLHWFFPLPRPKGSAGAEQLAAALENARAAELASRRAEPLRPTAVADMAGIFLAQMQTLRRMASARPAMGRRKVFVIGDAERLVPQESSPEAANALLKLLEEPPADTTIILTAADPTAILPTVRSRLLPVPLQPLAEDQLAAFLAERGIDGTERRAVARLAGGSIGVALAFLPTAGEPGPLEAVRQQARAWLAAALDEDAAGALTLAAAQSPSGARAEFSEALKFLTLWLRDLAAVAAGADELVMNAAEASWLRELAHRLPAAARRAPAALAHVETVTQWAQFNINPQLALAWLLRVVRRELLPGAG